MWSFSLALLDEKPVGVAGVGHVESNVRGLCVAIITRCASLFGGGSTGAMSALSTALLNALIKSEHMGNFAAEICSRARASMLPAELLHDISRYCFGYYCYYYDTLCIRYRPRLSLTHPLLPTLS